MANILTKSMGSISDFAVMSAKVAVLAFLVLSGSRLNAQSYVMNAGSPSFSANQPVENGFVNVSNGNLHLEIPLGSYPQRGGAVDKVALVYDSAIWFPDPSTFPATWEPTNIMAVNPPSGAGGWRLVSSGDAGVLNNAYTIFWCGSIGSFVSIWSDWSWTAQDGTQHAFPVETGDYTFGSCATDHPTASGYASDGSGFYISITGDDNATVYGPDGSVMSYGPYGTISGVSTTPTKQDSNGNSYTAVYSTSAPQYALGDSTMARNVVTMTQTSDGWEYDVPKFGGGTSAYTLHFGMQPVYFNTYFNDGIDSENTDSFQAPAELDLPDGTKYTFQYDTGTSLSDPTYHYGLLTQMTLPTGATIYYDYDNFTDAAGNRYRWIKTRQTPDSSTPWQYSGPSVLSSCTYVNYVNCEQRVTVTKPSGDKSVYTFALNGGAWPVEEQLEDSSSTPLATHFECYNFVSVASDGSCSYSVTPLSSPPYGATNVYKTSEITQLPLPSSGHVQATTEYGWGYFASNDGNLTTKSEWNFGNSPATASADRTTSITYYGAGQIINRPATIQVNGGALSKTVNSYDESGYVSSTCTSSGCGDLTTVSRYVNGSTHLDTHYYYDSNGTLTSMKDPAGNATTYSYDLSDANLTGIAYPSTGSVSHTVSFTPDSQTGLYSQYKDQNLNPFTYSYDSMARLTEEMRPDGGWTLLNYSSSGTQVDVYTAITGTSPTTSCPTSGNTCRHDQSLLDGLGRLSSQVLVSDPDGVTMVQTSYDSNGRVQKASNPYRSTSDPTYGWTTPGYDGLDRPIQVQKPDGSYSYAYYGPQVSTGGGLTSQLCSGYGSGYPVLHVDEAGKMLESWVDGFGRVIEVDEPDASSGLLSHDTCYSYDLNNNLTGVSSAFGLQTRSFSYDLLSRLTSASNPETSPGGSICPVNYTYDNNGNVLSKTSGQPNQTSCTTTVTINYAYDALNRLTSETSTDGTIASYYSYDQSSAVGVSLTNYIGRLTSQNTGSSGWITATAFSYDKMGRPAMNHPYAAGVYENNSFTYNLDGSLASVIYPSGREIDYTPTSAGRPHQAVWSAWSVNYAQSATFAPQGELAGAIYGATGGFTGITESRSYNPRFQPTSIQASSSAGTALNLSYTPVSGNDGSIQTETNNVDTGRTQSFSYDTENRLATGQTAATSGADCWGQNFGYDSYGDEGNLIGLSVTKCSAPHFSVGINNNNQLDPSYGFSYDAAGNMINDGAYSYTYDAENRILSASGMAGGPYCYTYDASGFRVAKANGSSCSSASVDVLYWRNPSGATLAETDSTGNPWASTEREHIFFAGRQIADLLAGNQYYFFSDHLGSVRDITDSSGNVCYDTDYYPYGQEAGPYIASTCPQNFKFTGYERDPETGNDYAYARYYNPRLSRFMSPDPGNAGADPANPQSWNGYSYALNNPLTFTDPSGMCADGEGADCDPIEFPCFLCGDPVPTGPGPSGPETVPDANEGTHSPGGSGNGDPDPNGPFSGPVTWPDESFGIPNGMQLPGLSLPELLGMQTPPGLIFDINGEGPQFGPDAGSCAFWDTECQNADNGLTISLPVLKNPAQKVPCNASTRMVGVAKAADGLGSAITMVNLGALHFFGGGVIIGATCLTPEPGEPVACAAGGFAGLSLFANGAAMGYGAFKVATHEMIPGIKQAITCHE